MVSPVQYANRYWNLGVYFDSGPLTVRISRYHIGNPTAAKDRLWSALRTHFSDHQRRDPSYSLELRVNIESAQFSNRQEVLHHVVRPFYGKGSPEDYQIVLQLAVLLGVVSKSGLQGYANDNLGLDCNGFVGNYLFHERAGNPWNIEPTPGQVGPSSLITQISQLGRTVQNLDAMSASKTYLLAEVDAQGHVIPGGSGGAGHITITEPNRFNPQSFVADSFGGLDFRASTMGAYANPAYWVVESTGGIGLTESWYAFPRNQFNNGVCRVFRGCKGTNLKFKISELY
jgi:hypothetical protein